MESIETFQQLDENDDLRESLRKTHTFHDQIQANIGKVLINIGENIDKEYADYEAYMKKDSKSWATDSHLTAVSASLILMKSALNKEIKRIAKEI
jgi:hypothetical protein